VQPEWNQIDEIRRSIDGDYYTEKSTMSSEDHGAIQEI